MFTSVLDRYVARTNFSEGADRCGGKECLFSDVTSSVRIWRRKLESDARGGRIIRLQAARNNVNGDLDISSLRACAVGTSR